ncbi:MAG: hypothetical protein F6J87_16260 [Spirulina sp. SIO3F2]|nr:hypothetical protein [Spirulina sp. SIO3F2]
MTTLDELNNAIKILQEANDLEMLGRALHNKGVYLREYGLQEADEQALADARKLFLESAQTSRQSGAEEMAIFSCLNAAIAAQELGEYREDEMLLSTAITEFQALLDSKDINNSTRASAYNTLGNALCARAPMYETAEQWSQDIFLAIDVFKKAIPGFATEGNSEAVNLARLGAMQAYALMAELMALDSIPRIQGQGMQFYLQKAGEQKQILEAISGKPKTQ